MDIGTAKELRESIACTDWPGLLEVLDWLIGGHELMAENYASGSNSGKALAAQQCHDIAERHMLKYYDRQQDYEGMAAEKIANEIHEKFDLPKAG